MVWQVSCGHFWSYCLKICSHMSEAKGQQVMEHSLFPLDFHLPDLKDTLQTAPKCYQLKIQSFANVICRIHVVSANIYIMSEMPFWSCNFDMSISYSPIFFLKALCTRLLIIDFNRLCGIEVPSVINQMSGLKFKVKLYWEQVFSTVERPFDLQDTLWLKHRNFQKFGIWYNNYVVAISNGQLLTSKEPGRLGVSWRFWTNSC